MTGNPFLYKGDSNTLDQLYTIQQGTVVSVDEDNALVQVEWTDKVGARLGVPFPMPFAGNGWGIWAMPNIGESVLIGFRQNQFPVILAWSPFNTSSPFSYYNKKMGRTY